MVFLLIKINKTKLPRRGKKRTACNKAWQGKTRQEPFDGKLAQDCKHKEIIKGANEEGNNENTVGENEPIIR